MHPILFRLPEWLGGVPIPAYGAFMALGSVLGTAVFAALARRDGYSGRRALELMLSAILVGLVASKLVGLLVQPATGVSFLETIARTGGVWYVGFLTSVGVAAWRMNAAGMATWVGLDRAAPGVALGHALGRIGCHLAGCCWGTRCDLPWAVTFGEAGHRNTGVPAGVALHPVQLYEAAGELVIAALLTAMIVSRRYRFHGLPGLSYLVSYGVLRFVIEWLRDDPRGGLGPLSTSQWIAAVAVTAAGAGIVLGWRHGSLAPWRPPVPEGDVVRHPPGPGTDPLAAASHRRKPAGRGRGRRRE